MSDEVKPGDNGELKSEQQKQKDMVMTITLTEQGQLSVQAPGNGKLYDLPMALYLMELAKDHIKAVNRVQSQSKIIQAKPRIKDIFFKR